MADDSQAGLKRREAEIIFCGILGAFLAVGAWSQRARLEAALLDAALGVLSWLIFGGLALLAAVALALVWLVWRLLRRLRPMTGREAVRRWKKLTEPPSALAPVLRHSTPTLWKREWGRRWWTLTVKLADGHHLEEVVKLTPNLESIFRTRGPGRVRVSADPGRTDRVRIRTFMEDPLAEPVPWEESNVATIYSPIALGVNEHGHKVRVRLIGQHVLIAGVTGAGKSTCIEDVIRGLIPMSDAEIWGIDMKPGALELGRFRDHLARLASEPKEATQLLQAARQEIEERGKVMGPEHLQEWPCTSKRPAIVLIIDELAELPPEAKVILESLVRLSRAYAVIVVAATQHPSVKTFGELGGSARSQMTCTIGLRVSRRDEARMIFGEDAPAAGWDNHKLTVPGSFLIRDGDHPDPERSRCYWPGDTPIPEAPESRPQAAQEPEPEPVELPRGAKQAAALAATQELIRQGKARKRPPICEGEGCGKAAKWLQIHHWDYDRPELFSWLCPTCHAKADRERKAAEDPSFEPDSVYLEMIRLKQDGMGWSDIAARYGMSYQTAYKRCRTRYPDHPVWRTRLAKPDKRGKTAVPNEKSA